MKQQGLAQEAKFGPGSKGWPRKRGGKELTSGPSFHAWPVGPGIHAWRHGAARFGRLAFCSFFFSIFFFLCINILTSSLFAIVCIWIMHGCYCCIELIVLSGYIYQCFRFVLPLPDRNRRVPVRNIPFSISRNTGFVFPSGLPVPVSVLGKKKYRSGNG